MNIKLPEDDEIPAHALPVFIPARNSFAKNCVITVYGINNKQCRSKLLK